MILLRRPGYRSRYSDSTQGWAVRGLKAGEMRFSLPAQTGPEGVAISCTMGTGCFPVVKRPGRGVNYSPVASARLKNEKSYTSSPPLGFCGLLQGDLYLL
jgi:hypothetical protein